MAIFLSLSDRFFFILHRTTPFIVVVVVVVVVVAAVAVVAVVAVIVVAFLSFSFSFSVSHISSSIMRVLLLDCLFSLFLEILSNDQEAEKLSPGW